jgi:hypothetical protein
METFSAQFWLGLGVNILSSFLGVIAAYFLGRFYYDRCYAGWRVRLIKENKERLDRSISPRKAREICDEPADLSVFLKGVASPYGYITCDIIQDGEALGLLSVEEVGKDFRLFNRKLIRRYIRRTYTINIDKNPKPDNPLPARPGL